MANRYANLVGTKKISEDFNNINIGFDRVQADMDTNKGVAEAHINNTGIHVTPSQKAEWDAKAPGSTLDELHDHMADQAVHVTQADHDKLDSIEDGAEVNQPAFAKVNDIEAADPSDAVTIKGGIGITVTTNPNSNEVEITATGDAAPGAHGPTHTEYGADPIPAATVDEGGIMSAEQVAELITHGELLEEQAQAITELEDRLDTADTADLTLQPGLQVVNAAKDARFNLGKIEGKTLLNRIGSDWGPRKSINRFSGYQATLAVDHSKTVVGGGSIKISGLVANNIAQAVGSTQTTTTAGKKYIALGYLFNESGASMQIAIEGTAVVSQPSTITNRWELHYVKSTHSIDVTRANVVARLNTTAAGQVGYADGLRMYEISDAEYAALDGMTPEQIVVKYPYVDSVQSVSNPYAIRYGENLLPPFYEWTHSLPRHTVQTAPYELEMTVSDGNEDCVSYVEVPVNPNTDYTYSTEHTGYISVTTYLGEILVDNTAAQSVTFNTGNRHKVVLNVYNNRLAGTFNFKNPMLTIGSTSKPFKPREDSMLAFQTELHANPVDGSDPDVLFEREGQYFKLAKWKKVVLDGGLDWRYNNAIQFTGFKRVWVSGFALGTSNQFATKYNGSAMTLDPNVELPDCFVLSSVGTIHVTIPIADSGWGDDYEPSQDEIKAYFMGWKMYPYGDAAGATAAYNGTGTKGWCYRIDGKTGNTNGDYAGGVSTLPTTQAPGYTPYQLLYRLATPTVEPVVSEGCLTLIEGDNQVEVGTGIVLRENAKPYRDPTTLDISINALPASYLNYKADKILNLYADNGPITNWTEISKTHPSSANGAWINLIGGPRGETYDPSAAYSVTYLKLDKSPIQPISGSLAANEKAQISDLTAGVAEALQRVSVVEMKKAEADASGWIAPTFLNGASQYPDLSFGEVGYRLTPDGMLQFRGLLRTTAIGTAFYLPVGYRPAWGVIVILPEGRAGSEVRINTDGSVYVNEAHDWLSLSAIPPIPVKG
ncbi:hypothetical protein ABDI30_11885 [Paenibacillus cisolokensis]|uniref:hypothetical protein n=1 Tax=Paenibacillus cisolokensis TaxID=1658519 RepID=UPI003D2A3784